MVRSQTSLNMVAMLVRLLFLLMCFSTSWVWAQQIECESIPITNAGFEGYTTSGSTNDGTGVNDGCVLPWFTPQGSPTVYVNGSSAAASISTSAYEGDVFIGLGAMIENTGCTNEAIVIPLAVTPGSEYTISFYCKVATTGSSGIIPVDVHVYYTNGLLNDGSVGGAEACNLLTLSPNSSPGDPLIGFSTDCTRRILLYHHQSGIFRIV